jgi:6-pyruvoyltetrahydropterin/6-carboxytetrahydropterin synthase
MVGLGAHYELEITAVGRPDPQTGYFLDIKVLDRAARGTIIPHIVRAFRARPMTDPAALLHEPGACDALAAALAPDLAARSGRVTRVRWKLSPFFSVEAQMNEAGTAALRGSTMIRQRFEIAAAHRLHVPGLSDAANRATFGKCNNPSGHGHNYVIEPAVVVDGGGADQSMSLARLEAIVHEHIIEPFDHTHLNVDRPEFDFTRGGVNPSVEHIAEVFYRRLTGPVAAAGGRLAHVTVWETEKTSATFGE